MLTQVREDEVTINYCARAPFTSKFWGMCDLGKGREIFPVANNQSREKWILGRFSKNILGLKNCAIEKQGKC